MDKEKIIQRVLKDLDGYFYGPNFWQSGLHQLLKDLTAEQALWKPSPERNSIWQIVRHINAWKWFSTETLKGNKIENMKAHNWTQPETQSEEEWKSEIEKLVRLHSEMKELIAKADDSIFNTEGDISGFTREVIFHDCYHAGQIGLLRVLQGLKPIE